MKINGVTKNTEELTLMICQKVENFEICAYFCELFVGALQGL